MILGTIIGVLATSTGNVGSAGSTSMITVILPALIAAAVSLTVMQLTPYLTFVVWKKQKLREQQLAVAARYAELSANEYVVLGIRPGRPTNIAGTDDYVAKMAPHFQEAAVYKLIAILFKHKRVHELTTEIRDKISN